MFSVVIKNSVLMLLLILIIHFMIINYISDIQNQYNSMKKTTNNTNHTDTITTSLQPQDTDLQGLVDHKEDHKEDHKSFTSFKKLEEDVCVERDDHKELYDFVYLDKTAEEELNMLYKEVKPCDIDSDKIVDCTPDDQRGGDISFCKNDVDKHFENKNLERLQQDSEEVTKDGQPIVFKYNESQKDLLDGFESFGSSFMLLKN